MSSLNSVCLIGNVGRDPEIRSTQDGRRIANLTIATSESWKDKNTGERKERTEWHKVVVMDDALSSVVERYVKKGTKLYIEGSLQTRKWTDKDGVEKYTTEIVMQKFRSQLLLLSGNQSEDGAAQHHKAKGDAYQTQSAHQPADLSDEIPW